MNQLNRSDLQLCLQRCPRHVLEVLKGRPAQIYVAGGFIRSVIANEEINDVDLFVGDAKVAEHIGYEMMRDSSGRRIMGASLYKTENAVTVKGLKGPVVQIIHRWTFTNPADAIQSFDFSVACAAFWWQPVNAAIGIPAKWESLCDDHFYPDLAAKRLRYRSPVRNEEAGGSMLRVLKFYKRGYRIPVDSLAAVIARLMTGVTEKGLLELQKTYPNLSGEEAETRVITKLLREVDPTIDASHIAHLPAEENQ